MSKEGLLELLAARGGKVYPKVLEGTCTCWGYDFKLRFLNRNLLS